MKKIIVGYGNPDRGDDGVAFKLLQQLLKFTGNEKMDLLSSDLIPLSTDLDLWFNLQLLPEFADTIANYKQALFVDAHTGEIEEDIQYIPIEPNYQSSPFTHHFTPASCLALAQEIAGNYPDSWMLSIRGYRFDFDQNLSPKTEQLLLKAVQMIKDIFLE